MFIIANSFFVGLLDISQLVKSMLSSYVFFLENWTKFYKNRQLMTVLLLFNPIHLAPHFLTQYQPTLYQLTPILSPLYHLTPQISSRHYSHALYLSGQLSPKFGCDSLLAGPSDLLGRVLACGARPSDYLFC